MSPKDLKPDPASKMEIYEFIRTIFTGVITSCVIYGISVLNNVADLAKAHDIIIKEEDKRIAEIISSLEKHENQSTMIHLDHDKRLRTLEVTNGIK